MTREIVLRIPEERAVEMLSALTYDPHRPTLDADEHARADLRDLLQRAVDEAAQERLRREVE